jgi:hypothetical protein
MSHHNPEDIAGQIQMLQQSLQNAIAGLYHSRSVVGSLPPQPRTLRGRVGRALVGVVQRMLFWLMPQLDAFHAASVEMMENQMNALDAIAKELLRVEQESRAAIADIRESQRKLATIINGKSPPAETLASVEPNGISEIDHMAATIERERQKLESLVWMQSIKWRSQIEDLTRTVHKSTASGK